MIFAGISPEDDSSSLKFSYQNDDARILNNNSKCLTVFLDRCRLRRKMNDGPGKICMNELLWKDLDLGYTDWELYLQELDHDEPIIDPISQTSLIVRQYLPVANTAGPLQEIVLNEPNLANLKVKVRDSLFLRVFVCVLSIDV